MRFFTALLILLAAGAIAAPAARAELAGRVTFDGDPPPPAEIDTSGVADCHTMHEDEPLVDESLLVSDGGGLANVVITLHPETPPADAPAPATQPAVLDQRGCRYAPRVLVVRIGQELVVKNSDPLTHNVAGITDRNEPFNFSQNAHDDGVSAGVMTQAETFRVKCAVHPWMLAWIVVTDAPYHAVSDVDGRYTIAGAPDGRYTLRAWHELLGAQEHAIEIKDGVAEQDIVFRPE